MKGYKYLLLITLAIGISCNNNKSAQPIQKQYGVSPKNKRSVIFKSKPLHVENSRSVYTVFDEQYQNKKAIFKKRDEYLLDITKLQYPEARIFIYDYQFVINDTLEIYKDSIRFNSELVRKISSKDFKFKDRTIQIDKYFYSGYGNPANYSANLYIAPVDGLILKRVISQGSGFAELNKDSEVLQKLIEQDSVFFKFEGLRLL